jgi:hypothetical protein
MEKRVILLDTSVLIEALHNKNKQPCSIRMNLHRIIHIEHIAPLTLRFEFDDGETVQHDFHEEVNHFPESPVITALADTIMFRSAVITRSGRAVEWANGYDLCADQCRLWLGDTAALLMQTSEIVVAV